MASKNNVADIEQIITAALEDWNKQVLSSGAKSKESQKAGSKAMKLLYQNTDTLKEYLPQLIKNPNARHSLEQIIMIGDCWTDEEYATMGGEDDFNIYCSELASPEVLADLEKQRKPDDLIDLSKAVSKYHRSRAQLKRDIDNEEIKSYRKKPKGKHYISESEANNIYLSKDSLA